MRQHNTLFNKVAPPPKRFNKPKLVVTVPISGNLGKGLTRELYQGLLNSIDTLNETTAVQRKEYDAYVEYNEKATVRSDYNIADITKLAKSLERLIDELLKKLAIQDKWNAYFKMMIALAGDSTNTNILIDDRTNQLLQQIDLLRLELNASNANDSTVELRNEFDDIATKIKNIARILLNIPGIVVDLGDICNKEDGGFEIKYKTVNFLNINLDATLPNEDSGFPDAESLPTEGNDFEDNPDAPEDLEPEIPGTGEDAFSLGITLTTITSPTDMKFTNLYADLTKLTDVNKTLELLKNAITLLSSNSSSLSIIFTAEVLLLSATSATTFNRVCAIPDLTFSTAVEGYNLLLNVSSVTTDFKIYSVSTNIIYTGNSVTYNNLYKEARGWGGLQVIHSRISSSSNKRYSIDMQLFALGNNNNNSWLNEQWTNGGGIIQFHIVAFGTIGTTSSSPQPSVEVTMPNAPEFTQSCGTSTSVDIEPEPEPEEET